VSRNIGIETNKQTCKPTVKTREMTKDETVSVGCDGEEVLKSYDLRTHGEVKNRLSIEISREKRSVRKIISIINRLDELVVV